MVTIFHGDNFLPSQRSHCDDQYSHAATIYGKATIFIETIVHSDDFPWAFGSCVTSGHEVI